MFLWMKLGKWLALFREDHELSLNDFIKELENQRRIHLLAARTDKKIREIREATATPVNMVGATAECTPKVEEWLMDFSSELSNQMTKGQEALVRAIDEMGRNMSERSQRPPRKKYCGYCRTDQHWSSECPKKPERGSCFDCMKVGHRRGDPSCPKKQQ